MNVAVSVAIAIAILPFVFKAAPRVLERVGVLLFGLVVLVFHKDIIASYETLYPETNKTLIRVMTILFGAGAAITTLIAIIQGH